MLSTMDCKGAQVAGWVLAEARGGITVAVLRPKIRAEGRLKEPMGELATGEYSPAFAKRNEVPHEPLGLKPASSESIQVNPTFGLLVPPVSVPEYWSWRHEASRSSRRKN